MRGTRGERDAASPLVSSCTSIAKWHQVSSAKKQKQMRKRKCEQESRENAIHKRLEKSKLRFRFGATVRGEKSMNNAEDRSLLVRSTSLAAIR